MPDPGLRGLARPDGTFVMVAMDQRESLRGMLAQTSGRGTDAVPDAELREFKQDVAVALGPEASGFLADPEFGEDILAGSPSPGPRTGRIVAADRLAARPGEVVGDAVFDQTLDLPKYAAQGVVAAKLLIVWREDEHMADRVEDAARFVAACRDAGMPSIVEGVVRPTGDQQASGTFDREAALLRCARELGAVEPSLYKAEVPYFGRGDADRITAAAAELTGSVACPWVVLSSHVERADFPAAVAACCRGGASGMLAGRALWTNALPAADRKRLLREESVPYLRELAAIVSANARPWPDA
ncbi:sulfofructosephosphate aldolase [Actinopolymorpha cephalotaxi]|uniref:Sulfofructosephosphate aldolase n=1 Tax=Actinopolymorpha cephalotaxi TaxID=504797 RepID=A0A1I2URY4_9ACTN|nr:hypothetical protein [Actinopolymorpha cephalotaxi]NYH86635.1 sulfofructosephosphate aldolase [Actinopolymorpha cephalotaxi]SFG77666.1 sulfofructosephosphate aldolase [Actinopolymorpha cephalotaxi]